MIGTQKDDLQLMVHALEQFNKKAEKKFIAGIKEHNSDGKHGMHLMDIEKSLEAVQEEVIDLWFYIITLKSKIKELSNEKSPSPHKT